VADAATPKRAHPAPVHHVRVHTPPPSAAVVPAIRTFQRDASVGHLAVASDTFGFGERLHWTAGTTPKFLDL
jgi:hypothetical protein